MWRKSWKTNTFSAEKCFFMKNTLTKTFLRKANFTSLFKRKRRENIHKTPRFLHWNLKCKTTINRGLFFYATSLSLFLDTMGTSFSTFSNITLFQKCNKTKAVILISLLHKTWLTKAIQFWMLYVSRQRPMKSLSSVCPSVRRSLSFLKTGSLMLFDIERDYNWTWYLVTDEVGYFFLKKENNGSQNLSQNRTQN